MLGLVFEIEDEDEIEHDVVRWVGLELGGENVVVDEVVECEGVDCLSLSSAVSLSKVV